MPEAATGEAWSEDLLDGASFRLAERAARAAGLPVEAWIDRAIRGACASTGEVALPASGAAAPEEPVAVRAGRGAWRVVLALALPLLLLGGFAFLALPFAGSGVRLALPPAPNVVLALPPGASEDREPSDARQLAAWLAPRASAGDAQAQYRLGTLYALGKGVDKDYARAAPLLRAAAESGLAEAEYDYAVLCENGFGVAKDPVQALAWYRKAAAQGHANAALALGYACAKGIGTARDMAEAAQWFRRGSELGLADAQYNLAFLYEHGEGVASSPIDAYAWYAIAGAHGDRGAQQSADRLAKSLSAAQMKEALARLNALHQSIKSER
ncbi:MAG TPA: tetratricopeptide repeat protein [Stellaceae bacterium]|nr:tetratricopeptide repeat protein [Stellaceae bacterium]